MVVKLHLKKIASLGATARYKKYGNPGTAEGRRKGGLKSLQVNIKKRTKFKTIKEINIPSPSTDLAELLGIFMGDGHVGKYQASVSTNATTDIQHALYTQLLINRLFDISSTIRNKKETNACEVVVSSKNVCVFLNKQGLPIGNKVRDGVSIPSWIQKNKNCRRAFVRGLFDADGSVYTDVHRYKNKIYCSNGMAFTNRSHPLLSFFKAVLEEEGFHPTQKTKFTVFLRRKGDIEQYFALIGTSNQKHAKRFVLRKSRRSRIVV